MIPTTLERIKLLIVRSLNLEGMSAESIGDETPLFGGGLGLDSVDALELVVHMEKEFNLKIRSDEIDPAILASPQTLARFVDGRLAEPGPA